MNTLIKGFREKITKLKDDISDKEFFLSKSCCSYLQSLVDAATKKYNSPINLKIEWGDPNGNVAYATDRNLLYININNCFFNSVTKRIEKLVLLKGLLLHECGHLLFTDFHILKSTTQTFLQHHGKLFPTPKTDSYHVWETDAVLMEASALQEWMSIWSHLQNAVEDGFVEKMILKTVPGDGQCLCRLRDMQKSSFDPIKVQRNNGLATSAILFNSILSLSKFDTVNMDEDDRNDEAIKKLLKNYNLIKAATSCQKSYDRLKLINEIFVNLYKFMKEEEEAKSNPQNSSDPDPATENNASSESDGNNETNNETGKSIPSAKNLMDNAPIPDYTDDIDTKTGSVLNDKNISQDPQQQGTASDNDKIASMQEQKEFSQGTAQIPSPEDLREVENIAETIAKERLLKEQEDDLAANLAAEMKNQDFGPINRSVNANIIREYPSANAYQIYEDDMQEIGFLVNKMVNEIRRKIKDHQNGGKLNGLYMGRYLDQHSLSRYDGRCLCRNDLPEDIPNMAIGILIDSSGSMNRDSKYVYARRTALLIYEFGMKLNIPIMVYAHNATHQTQLFDLADYNSVDGKDRYRICDLTPGGCNRDGMALRFCSKKLSERKETTKIMFVISDGKPSDYDSEEDADRDIKQVLLDFGKENIKYITIGIGSDQAGIEKYYSQNLSPKVAARFLSCEDPSLLPVTVVETIKQMIKV